jgi:uncharacterized membrane protein
MAFCSKCGAQVAEQSEYCPQCGQPQPAAKNPAPAASTQSGLSENVAGLLCYLVGWVTGLIFFLIDKRPYVRFHAAQSLVVFGGLHILRIGLAMIFGMGFMFGGGMGWTRFSFGWMLFSLIGLVGLVLWILLMVKAYQGERFKVPIAGDLAESFAGK